MNRRQLKEAKKELLILQGDTDNSHDYKSCQKQIDAIDAKIAAIQNSYGWGIIIWPVLGIISWSVISPIVSGLFIGQPKKPTHTVCSFPTIAEFPSAIVLFISHIVRIFENKKRSIFQLNDYNNVENIVITIINLT